MPDQPHALSPMIHRLVGYTGLAVGLVLVVLGTTFMKHHTYRTPTATGVVPAVTTDSALSRRVETQPRLRARAEDVMRASSVGRPLRLRILALGVDAPIVPEGVGVNRSLGVPDDPAVVGWWKDSAKVGEKKGTVVLDGHVDTNSAGPGALYPLETLTPGSRLSIMTSAGSVDYRMVARAVYQKTALPAELFATYGQPRLAIVTCGGPFDISTGHYLYNVVVYALPVDAPAVQRDAASRPGVGTAAGSVTSAGK